MLRSFEIIFSKFSIAVSIAVPPFRNFKMSSDWYFFFTWVVKLDELNHSFQNSFDCVD